jgi:hypothetical protein
MILTPAGTLAALTLNLPSCSAGVDGQENYVKTSQTITALTVTATAGTVLGAPTTLLPGTLYMFHCTGSVPSWN